MESATAVDTPQGGGRPLKRQMGLWAAVALVIGNMVGSGIFLLPAALAAAAGQVTLRDVRSYPRPVGVSTADDGPADEA